MTNMSFPAYRALKSPILAGFCHISQAEVTYFSVKNGYTHVLNPSAKPKKCKDYTRSQPFVGLLPPAKFSLSALGRLAEEKTVYTCKNMYRHVKKCVRERHFCHSTVLQPLFSFDSLGI